MSERIEAVERALADALARRGYELFDVTVTGTGRARSLRVAVDREGGIDLDGVTEATHVVSEVLDRDDTAVEGPYTLEVTSPGVERPLRRPEHFRRAVGETVTVKTRDADGAAQRIRGVLAGADENADGGITLQTDDERRQIAYDAMEGARTVFEWGPAPPPGRSGKKKAKKNRPRGTDAPRRAEAAEERQSR
jgi:ribosome maturation factor RimP